MRRLSRAVERVRIILACLEGKQIQQAAQELSTSIPTVTKWRRRFSEQGLQGLSDRSRPEKPPKYGSVRGASFASKTDPRAAIEAFAARTNQHPKPFHWRKREVKGSRKHSAARVSLSVPTRLIRRYNQELMSTAEAIHELRDEVLRVIARHGAGNARLFGSAARGEDTPDSDIDLLIDVTGVTTPCFRVALPPTWSNFWASGCRWSSADL